MPHGLNEDDSNRRVLQQLLLRRAMLCFCAEPSKCWALGKGPSCFCLRPALPTLLKTFALSLTNILPSLTKLHFSPKPVTITFVSFAVSGLTLIPLVLVPLLPLSFTPSLTTVILSTVSSLSLNYPVSRRSRTLVRTVVKAPKSCHITHILHCLHWLRITECIEYKLLSYLQSSHN